MPRVARALDQPGAGLRSQGDGEAAASIKEVKPLDRLRAEGLASMAEYHACIAVPHDANGGVVRLPEDELRKRLGARQGPSRHTQTRF